METGPSSGWCAFTDGKVDCSNAEAGDCTPANYGPKETQDGDAYGMSTGAWESAQVARYVRHWSGRGQNTGVHFMEIDVYGEVSVMMTSLAPPHSLHTAY